MIKFLSGLLLLAIAVACNTSSNQNFEEELKVLTDNQAKVSIIINGKNFYDGQEIFTGSGYALDSSGVKISLKNQAFGNIIVSLEGQVDLNKTPLKLSFRDGFPEGSVSGSFLIGKILDSVKNTGEGYILTDGGYEILQLDNMAIIIKVKGQLRKPFGDSGLSDIEGYIVWNKPEVVFTKKSN